MEPKYKNLHAPTATIDRLAEMAQRQTPPLTPPQMLKVLLDLAEAVENYTVDAGLAAYRSQFVRAPRKE
jgi:hypothetical protein